MFKITMPEERKLKQNYFMLIYGKPGIGKTTTALSAENPILLDYEHGIDRVPQEFWKPALDVSSFEQVVEFLNSPQSDQFDTIVIDSMEQMIEKAINRVIALDCRLKMRNGNLSIQGYGVLKNLIADFFRSLKSKNKNLIFVAHSEERESIKDQKEIVPRMGSGSSARVFVNDMDIIAYMDKDGNETKLKFASSDLQFYSKNSLLMPDEISVPNPLNKAKNTFLSNLISKYQEMRNEEVKKFQEECFDISKKILEITDASGCDKALKYFSTDDRYSKNQIWRDKLHQKSKALGLIFNQAKGKFENEVNNTIAV